MRKVRMFSIFTLLVTVLLGIAPPAIAQGPTLGNTDYEKACAVIQEIAAAGDKAEEFFATLSPEEQAQALQCLTVDHVETMVTESTDGSVPQGCKSYTYSVRGKGLWGQILYTYYQRIYWCYNGTSITSKSLHRWGQVFAPLWRFFGHVAQAQWGGVGWRYYRSWTKGHFALCTPWGCAQNKYPVIDMTVRGNGSYSGYGYPE